MARAFVIGLMTLACSSEASRQDRQVLFQLQTDGSAGPEAAGPVYVAPGPACSTDADCAEKPTIAEVCAWRTTPDCGREGRLCRNGNCTLSCGSYAGSDSGICSFYGDPNVTGIFCLDDPSTHSGFWCGTVE
jgi:hypothetical protein